MNNKSKILIVDDQLIGRQLLESILFKEEYELFFAEDGEEALEQTITHKPDLVLLDVMMPKIDGFEVCRRIRKDKEIRDTPVIMVTALDDRDSRLMGFDAGANDYVSKPIDRQELLARVKNITDMNRFRKLAFFDESTANTEESDIQPSKAEFKDSAERIEKLHHFLKIKSNENPALFFKLFSGLDSSRVPEFRSLEKHGEMLGMYVHPQIEYMPEIALLSEIAFYQLAEKYTEKGPDHLLNGILETLNQWANEAGVHLDTSTLPLAVLSVNRNQRLLYLASRNVFIW
ncbi:MAG: response regulator, partial [Bacteroidota bacterium]